MKISILMTLVVAVAITITSCSKDSESTSNYEYKVRMTDAPGPYSQVNIDIQNVEVTGGNGQSVMLNTTARIYNLLELTNGVDVLLAKSVLTDANVKQIRFILGPNNTIVKDGVTYPLSTPSAEQSGLKLMVNQTLTADIENTILIDFDANTSIVETGSGTFKLKPVLRTIVKEVSGNIIGSVTPVGMLANVTATSTTTSFIYTSSVNAAGNFKIVGLPAGKYDFTITPALPLLPISVSNINVQVGANANAGVFVF